ncbi:MAG: Slp family lipoprotein [Gammaproteobacteria bacterium]
MAPVNRSVHRVASAAKPAFWAVLAAIVTGCATTVPPSIREPVAGAPQFAAVRGNAGAYLGRSVRWGGTIAALENRKNATWIEVVARPLPKGGRPEDTDVTDGRFIAQIHGFLDPAVYAVGRALTVTGKVSGAVRKDIGQYPYLFPTVDVSHYYLWAPLPAYEPDYWGPPPWWYDPWYPYPRYGPPYWP